MPPPKMYSAGSVAKVWKVVVPFHVNPVVSSISTVALLSSSENWIGEVVALNVTPDPSADAKSMWVEDFVIVAFTPVGVPTRRSSEDGSVKLPPIASHTRTVEAE